LPLEGPLTGGDTQMDSHFRSGALQGKITVELLKAP
jgi:hypothetical protein